MRQHLKFFFGFRLSSILRTPIRRLSSRVPYCYFSGKNCHSGSTQRTFNSSSCNYGSLPQVSPDVCRADKKSLLPNPAKCSGLYIEEIRLNIQSLYLSSLAGAYCCKTLYGNFVARGRTLILRVWCTKSSKISDLHAC